MSDPLSQIVTLLSPVPSISKQIEGGGAWQVERRGRHSPFYGAVLEGCAELRVVGRAPLILREGDFILIPETHDFTLASLVPPGGTALQPLETGPGLFRLGPPEAPVDYRALVGHCDFTAGEQGLLLSLLPEVIHVAGEPRLRLMVQIIHDETRADRPARLTMLRHLLEAMLIEALRSAPDAALPPGLLMALSDPQLAPALRMIHVDPAITVPVADLARSAGLSRTVFFSRFREKTGKTPADYGLSLKMALARRALREGAAIARVARDLGYGSAGAFGAAFARENGVPPGVFAASASDHAAARRMND
ncbi:cupin domain-containing protein [Brucellaceae bacterium D45D]